MNLLSLVRGAMAPSDPPSYPVTSDRNRYWDDVRAATAGNGDETPEAELRRLAEPYMRPELMAIGGSVFNGTTSLKTHWWSAEWSTPTQVALALGLIDVETAPAERPDDPPGGFLRRTGKRRFWVPQYPDHGAWPAPPQARARYADGSPVFLLGLDLERVTPFRLWSALKTQAANALYLNSGSYRPPNGRIFNDNLGIFGADTRVLLEETPVALDKKLASPVPGGSGERYDTMLRRAASKPALGDLGAIRRAMDWANARFVLNPMRLGSLDGLTAIDQVELREPRRLLINVGSNEGIYHFMLDGWPLDVAYDELDFRDGAPKPWYRRCETIRQGFGTTYVKNMGRILERLDKVTNLQHVYINTNLRPTAAANLEPLDPADPQQRPGEPFPSYRPAFSTGKRPRLGLAAIEAANAFVRDVNGRIRAKADELNRRAGQTGPTGLKFVIVDFDELSDTLDFAHYRDRPEKQIEAGMMGAPPVRIDNRRLLIGSRPLVDGQGRRVAPAILQGGLFGADNLHPTIIGHARLALRIAKIIALNEELTLASLGEAAIKPERLYASSDLAAANLLRNADPRYQDRLALFQLVLDVAAFFRRTKACSEGGVN